MLFIGKKRGATPEPSQAKIRAHQAWRAEACGLNGPTQPAVLCEPEMPNNWQPINNNARYQQWVQRKGEAA